MASIKLEVLSLLLEKSLLQRELNALKKAQRELSQEKGRTATVDELAVAVDRSTEKIRALIRQANQPLSLEKKIGSAQETELGELLESEERSPEEIATRMLLRESLGDLLSELTSKEQTVIELRFGLKDGEEWTLETIGKLFNLSKERVRQIEAKAMQKLRKSAAQAQVQDYLEA